MPEHDTALIVMMVISIVLLIVSMGLAAHASMTSQGDKDCEECHKYSMLAAVVSGIAGALILIILVLYIFRRDIQKKFVERGNGEGAVRPAVAAPRSNTAAMDAHFVAARDRGVISPGSEDVVAGDRLRAIFQVDSDNSEPENEF